MRKFLLESLALLVLAAVCAAVSNIAAGKERKMSWVGNYPESLVVPKQPAISASASPAQQTPQTESRPSISGRVFAPHPDAPWVAVSSEEAWLLFQQGTLILDARRTEDYLQGHIAGARSFAVWESDIDAKVQSLLVEGIPVDSPILIYCSGGSCEDSRMLAGKLFEAGFNNALVYEGGFPDWQAQKRPAETAKGNL